MIPPFRETQISHSFLYRPSSRPLVRVQFIGDPPRMQICTVGIVARRDFDDFIPLSVELP
jgi:hypothetical protein